MTLELVCKVAGVEMGKYEVGPYLEEMKSKIEISYLKDILALIAERKDAARARPSSSSVQAKPGNATPNPALPYAQILSNNTEINSSTMGK